MDAPSRTRSRLGRPPKLRADAILDAAVELGLATFTVAQLGSRLGVSDGALYHHFPTRDAIVAAACSRLFAGVPTASATTAWDTYLEQICAHVRTVALAHPGFGRWLVGGEYDDATLDRFERILVGITERAPQFDRDTAYLVGSQAVACTVGLTTSGFVGAVPGEPTTADLEDQFRWMLRALLRGMAAELADGTPPPRRRALIEPEPRRGSRTP